MTDLWRLDAIAQAELVRSRQVTPHELAEAIIERIERLNPKLNAVITPLYEEALRSASEVGASRPFAGVPLLLKDALLQVDGTPYYLGTSVLRDAAYRSTTTTEMAHRFQRAGFVFVAKTNAPELSAGITTEPPAFGPTRNPWDLTRTAGGSSGGSAAAVAAGMTAVAHGSDGTGSLRYPAACCGVATLKPSRGRLPHHTPAQQPDPLGVWVEFVLTRSVRDLAGVLDAVAGPGPGQQYVAPPPARPYAQELGADPGRLRVGVLEHDPTTGMPVDPACVAAVRRAGEALSSLGHDVDGAYPQALDGVLLRLMKPIESIGSVARAAQLQWIERTIGRELQDGDISAEHVRAAAGASSMTALEYSNALATIIDEVRPVGDWWETHDLLVTPTLRQPPWPLGSNRGAWDSGVFPVVWSFTGDPAMSLPLHSTGDNLPVGVQLVSGYGREDVLFRVAAQLEEAMAWADRWPKIATSEPHERVETDDEAVAP